MVVPAKTHLRDIVTATKVSYSVAPSEEGVQAVTVLPQTMPLGGQSEAAGPVVPPANAVASPEGAASPARVDPDPYQPDEVIGGDSVLSIQRRLLASYSSPSAPIIQMKGYEAEDLFEVKKEIIKLMARYDPTGDWLNHGGRALVNSRTATGEYSLDALYHMRDDLKDTGPLSETFETLEKRMVRKK